MGKEIVTELKKIQPVGSSQLFGVCVCVCGLCEETLLRPAWVAPQLPWLLLLSTKCLTSEPSRARLLGVVT